MKKIIKTVMVVTIVLILLVSCGESNDTIESPKEKFSIVYEQNVEDTLNVYIIRDSNTDVLYMYTTGMRKAGLTPLINTDGSPVTYSQWILEYDDQAEEGDIE